VAPHSKATLRQVILVVQNHLGMIGTILVQSEIRTTSVSIVQRLFKHKAPQAIQAVRMRPGMIGIKLEKLVQILISAKIADVK